jgi:hypothetical protein
MSMQMDACFKKKQIGTLFVWVGAPEGGVRGWVVGQGGPAQILGMPVQKKCWPPPDPGLLLILMNFGFRGEYGKVR